MTLIVKYIIYCHLTEIDHILNPDMFKCPDSKMLLLNRLMISHK